MTSKSERAWEREDEMGAFAAREYEFAADEAAREQAKADMSLDARIQRAERRVRSLEAQSFGGIDHADLPAAYAELEALRAEATRLADEAFAAEWTREVTIERRAAWNDAIAREVIDPRTKKADTRKLHALIARMGFDHVTLKRAIALHQL